MFQFIFRITMATADPNLLELYEKVFFIPLTLTSILKNLTTNQLLLYRHVNSSWNEISTNILVTRRPLELKLTFCETPSRSDDNHDDDDNTVMLDQRQSADDFNADHHHLDKEQKKFYLTLDNLSSIMTNESSMGFPCVNFGFCVQNLGSNSIQKFFQCCGPMLKILELNFIHSQGETVDIKKLWELLTLQAPNVQILKINFKSVVIHQSNFDEIKSFDRQKTTIPRLKCLEFWHNSDNRDINSCLVTHDLELDLLRAAVNLVSWRGNGVDNFDVNRTINFVLLKKKHVVKNFYFRPFDNGRRNLNLVQRYEEFFDFFCHLKKLTVDTKRRRPNGPMNQNDDDPLMQDDIKVSTLLKKYLEMNKNSLDTLKVVGHLGFLPCTFIDMHIMPRVTKLKLVGNKNNGRHDNGNGHQRQQEEEAPKISMVPNWLSLSESFPCLSTIIFHSVIFDRENPTSYAREKILNFDPIPSVKNIEICPPWREGPLLILKEKFPKMRSLSVKGIFDFVTVGSLIWKNFEGLQTLQLSFLLDTEFDTAPRNWGWCGTYSFMDLRRGHVGTVKVAKSYPTDLLDSTFTGFSTTICKNFLAPCNQDGNDVVNPLENYEEVEKLRENASILNLKDLRSLHLEFEDCNDYSEEETMRLKSTILSELTGKFAFELMPRLQVTVRAKACHSRTFQFMKEALRPIQPFVENVSGSVQTADR